MLIPAFSITLPDLSDPMSLVSTLHNTVAALVVITGTSDILRLIDLLESSDKVFLSTDGFILCGVAGLSPYKVVRDELAAALCRICRTELALIMYTDLSTCLSYCSGCKSRLKSPVETVTVWLQPKEVISNILLGVKAVQRSGVNVPPPTMHSMQLARPCITNGLYQVPCVTDAVFAEIVKSLTRHELLLSLSHSVTSHKDGLDKEVLAAKVITANKGGSYSQFVPMSGTPVRGRSWPLRMIDAVRNWPILSFQGFWAYVNKYSSTLLMCCSKVNHNAPVGSALHTDTANALTAAFAKGKTTTQVGVKYLIGCGRGGSFTSRGCGWMGVDTATSHVLKV